MEFIRKHKKISIIVLVVLIVLLVFSMTLGRYFLNIINNYILETQGFYFYSSVLTLDNKGYSISNWDGVNSYTLAIDVTNRKNDERITKSDILYDIDVTCSSNVKCELSKNTGSISSDEINDSYQIIVTPLTNFYEGDVAEITTHATSTSPYKKTIGATYSIGVAKSNFSYNIEDNVNDKYLSLNFTNSITYYEVEEAFSTYQVGDQISVDDYNNLSDSDKSKCYSAIVTVEFDPNEILCDLTNDLFLDRLSTDYETVTIDGKEYVKKFSFKLNATSNYTIIFYKNDLSKNYTYPIVNDDSIVSVNVETAN